MGVWDIFSEFGGTIEKTARPLGSVVDTGWFKWVVIAVAVVLVVLLSVASFKQGIGAGMLRLLIISLIVIGLYKLGVWGYDRIMHTGDN
jgi:hypothetical protein